MIAPKNYYISPIKEKPHQSCDTKKKAIQPARKHHILQRHYFSAKIILINVSTGKCLELEVFKMNTWSIIYAKYTFFLTQHYKQKNALFTPYAEYSLYCSFQLPADDKKMLNGKSKIKWQNMLRYDMSRTWFGKLVYYTNKSLHSYSTSGAPRLFNVKAYKTCMLRAI